VSTAAQRTQVVPYEAARFWDGEATICAYLNEVLQHNDPQLLLMALGDIAKARGTNQTARAAGVEQERAVPNLKCNTCCGVPIIRPRGRAAL